MRPALALLAPLLLVIVAPVEAKNPRGLRGVYEIEGLRLLEHPAVPRHEPTSPVPVAVLADRADFDAAGGLPPVVNGFDEERPGVVLDGVELLGIRFEAVHAPLQVVTAEETFSRDWPGHRLHATSGGQILSPGGLELPLGSRPGVEHDDVVLAFDPPVSAFGFDLLMQGMDGHSWVDVAVYDTRGRLMYRGEVASERGPGLTTGESKGTDGGAWIRSRGRLDGRFSYPAPGHAFFGVVAAGAEIARVVIDDHDHDATNPDSNIGLDTLRYLPAPLGYAGDVDGNGSVGVDDLMQLIDQMDSCAATVTPEITWCSGDLDRDGVVDAADLVELLVGWSESADGA